MSENDDRSIQNDLGKESTQSVKWQMKFNVDKCKVIHSGEKAERKDKYRMLGKAFSQVQEEKDLDFIISNDLKSTKRSIAAAHKAI